MAVSKRLRYEILRRDNHTCRYCGCGVDEGAQLTIDHVRPIALGGTDNADNLVAACRDCNYGKSSSPVDAPLVDQVAQDAVRWAAAIKRAAEDQRAERAAVEAVVAVFDARWNDWTYGDGTRTVSRPADWQPTVARWVGRGMTAEDLVALIDNVLPRNVSDHKMWGYFCGAVRNTLAERADRAAEILAGEDD